MLADQSPSHPSSLARLLQGREDCVLVSSCGGRVRVHSLLLALHSPLLARLLLEVGEGERGVSLPLSLQHIRQLVAGLQGGEGGQEGKDLLDMVWRGEQDKNEVQKDPTFSLDKNREDAEKINKEFRLGLELFMCNICDDVFKDIIWFEKHLSKHRKTNKNTNTITGKTVEPLHTFYDDKNEACLEPLTQKKVVNVGNKTYTNIEDNKLHEIIKTSDDNFSPKQEEQFGGPACPEMQTPSLMLPNLVLPTKHFRNEQEFKDTKEKDATDIGKTAVDPIDNAINIVLEEEMTTSPLKEETKKRKRGKGKAKESFSSKIKPFWDKIYFENFEDSEKELDSTKNIYVCNICNDVFKDISRFRKHKIKHIELITKLLHCTRCVEIFENQDTLNRHLRNHRRRVITQEVSKSDDIVIKRCKICNFKSNVHELRKHMDTTHGEKSVPLFQCEKCPTTHRYEVKFEQHKLKHFPPTLPCKHCDKYVHTDNNLKEHIKRKHTPEEQKPYHCEECGKGFMDKGRLEDHINVHTGGKPFMCQSCVNAYSNRSNLNNHIREKHPESYKPGRFSYYAKNLHSVRALKKQKKADSLFRSS